MLVSHTLIMNDGGAANQSLLVDDLREVAHCDNVRFIMDLEFVELLASPQYLCILAQKCVLDKPTFLNYITYLQVRYPRHPGQ